MTRQVKNDKAVIICGLVGLIVAPFLASSWLIWGFSEDLDSLVDRFLMIVLLFSSAPIGALVGGFIGWLADKFLAFDAK